MYRVNSGVDGFIRETYDDSVGTEVKKDQKLASYYSPDFLAVASGFLAASERVPGSTGGDGNRTIPFPGTVNRQGVSSLQGYSDRLRNLGMSDVQIKQIADTRQLPDSIDVFAPADGFILAREHFARTALRSQRGVLPHRGSEQGVGDRRSLRTGGALSAPGRHGAGSPCASKDASCSARITDSLPQSETGGGTVKLRLEVDNPDFLLRPEMLVDVELPVRLPPAVTVPLDALVDSGARARVYVERGEGVFEPREVETGWRFGERVEIRHGVQPGERVVVAATFLVDSESRLKAPSSGSCARRGQAYAAWPSSVASGKDGEGSELRHAGGSGQGDGFRATRSPIAVPPTTSAPRQCKKTFRERPRRLSQQAPGSSRR